VNKLLGGERDKTVPLLRVGNMNVYLIRHAQSQDNLLNMSTRLSRREYNHLLRHAHESPLTPEGEQQAQAIGEKLRSASTEQLYTSPYPRALTTAQVIGQELALVAHICDDLREVQPLLLRES
jgi:broad specificity phosphatase PhoE